MKSFLPWVLVAALLCACYFLFTQVKDREDKINTLNHDNLELAQLRAENEELKKIPSPTAELERLRKEHEELLRLRNESLRSREQVKELTTQLASAQAQGQKVQELQQQAAQLSSENLNLQNQQTEATKEATVAKAQFDACVQNLRLIDAAKQEWALENKKTADDVPTADDITPYLPKGAPIVCPAGGTYSINSMRQPPTCSVPSHALPQ